MAVVKFNSHGNETIPPPEMFKQDPLVDFTEFGDFVLMFGLYWSRLDFEGLT